jgi:mRNA interferase HicA
LVNIYVHLVTSAEFKRWLERQGATFEPAKGGHIWVILGGRRPILPMHGSRKEMKLGTVAAIKRQLGVE